MALYRLMTDSPRLRTEVIGIWKEPNPLIGYFVAMP